MQVFELEQWEIFYRFFGTVIYTICNVTVGALIGVQVEGEVSAIGMAKTYGGVLYVFSGHLFPLTHTPYPFGWLPGVLPATHLPLHRPRFLSTRGRMARSGTTPRF